MAIELATAQTAPTAIEPIAARRRRLTAVMLADVVGYPRLAGCSLCVDQSRCGGATGAQCIQAKAQCAIRPRLDHPILQRRPIPKSHGASSFG